MLSSLLKSCQELDAYVTDANVWTTAMSEELASKFELYKLDIPPYPQPTHFDSFPLDFEAPEGVYV